MGNIPALNSHGIKNAIQKSIQTATNLQTLGDFQHQEHHNLLESRKALRAQKTKERGAEKLLEKYQKKQKRHTAKAEEKKTPMRPRSKQPNLFPDNL